jgi:hypothetical protein
VSWKALVFREKAFDIQAFQREMQEGVRTKKSLPNGML